ncbi:MAG: protease TldD [Elusimicrobia bacterium ADurb.Bin231]|nr:MAG: protease TldD [Elusimicrobia bacterium ADurb.Bin231]
MIDFTNAQIDSILKIIACRSGDFGEIFAEESASASISFIAGKVDRVSSGTASGFGLRLIREGETYYASGTDISFDLMTDLARKISGEKCAKELIVSEYADCGSHIPSVNSVALKDFVVVFQEIDKKFRKNLNIKQISFSVSLSGKKYFVANNNGIFIKNGKNSAVFVANITVSDGKTVQTAHEVAAETSLSNITSAMLRDVSLAAYSRADRLLNNAIPAPAGEMTAVICSSAGGTMIHEAIGHSLEADAVQKGISPVYKDKKGKKVASELITVIDDPTIPYLRGSYKYDDEGTPSCRTVLVENGILKNYLYDNYTAKKDGVDSTGNGRRQSYNYKPIPRMSNTYIAPGNNSPEQILRSVENGIFVKKMGGGQVNTANGDFIFEVEESYEIKNGEVGRMLRNASLIGNGPKILNSIDMVGKDLGWQPGTCGKDGQGVPVCDGQPTLRIPKIIVGGI